MGKTCKSVTPEKAYDYVFGYTVGQDVTARDWSRPDFNMGQFLLAKSMDTFCPLGPCIVTKDEIADPHNLGLKTWVNGVLKQNGHTGQLIHTVDKLISYLSKYEDYQPKDVSKFCVSV